MPNKHLNIGTIAFVGRYYDNLPGGQERVEILDFLKGRYVLDNYGGILKDSEIDYRAVPAMYNKAYVVICENNYNDIEDYFTPRNLGAMAAGSCALMRYFPGIENHFQNLTHCLYYRDKYELLEWIEYIIKNPAFRNHIAEHGYKLANDRFSPAKWAEDFNEIVKKHYMV